MRSALVPDWRPVTEAPVCPKCSRAHLDAVHVLPVALLRDAVEAWGEAGAEGVGFYGCPACGAFLSFAARTAAPGTEVGHA